MLLEGPSTHRAVGTFFLTEPLCPSISVENVRHGHTVYPTQVFIQLILLRCNYRLLPRGNVVLQWRPQLHTFTGGQSLQVFLSFPSLSLLTVKWRTLAGSLHTIMSRMSSTWHTKAINEKLDPSTATVAWTRTHFHRL